MYDSAKADPVGGHLSAWPEYTSDNNIVSHDRLVSKHGSVRVVSVLGLFRERDKVSCNSLCMESRALISDSMHTRFVH